MLYKMMPTTNDNEFDKINNNINNNNSNSSDNSIGNHNDNVNGNNNHHVNHCRENNDNNMINNNNQSTTGTGNNTQNLSGMSRAELRKSNKPIMEKRRRARINHCLNELKTLILEAMRKDPARHSKLEKADILEMTVKHLQSIQRQQLSLAIQTDPTVIHKFKAGFLECAEEVTRYISQLDGLDPIVCQRLSNHLNNCASSLEQIGGTFNNFPATAYSKFSASVLNSSSPSSSSSSSFNIPNPMLSLPQDVNNNGRIQMGGVQLIPSRLPTGEIALIMPNTTNIPFFPSNIQSSPSLDFSRTSAFSRPTPLSSSSTSSLFDNGNNRQTITSISQKFTVTSPPMSPVSSSSSSIADESSLMHTSADISLTSKTPPPLLQQNFSNIFPTPPNHENIKFSTSTLQQPQVSSTSENHFSSNSNQSYFKTENIEENNSRKRRYLNEEDSMNFDQQKRLKTEEIVNDSNGNVLRENPISAEESNEQMWRPW